MGPAREPDASGPGPRERIFKFIKLLVIAIMWSFHSSARLADACFEDRVDWDSTRQPPALDVAKRVIESVRRFDAHKVGDLNQA